MPDQQTNNEERPLRREDEAYLRQMLSCKEGTPLPPKVVREYWRAKAFADRISYPMQLTMLVEVLMRAGADAPAERAAPWIVKAYKTRSIKHGDALRVLWLGKERDARLIAVHSDGQRAKIQLDGDSEERYINAHDCLSKVEKAAKEPAPA